MNGRSKGDWIFAFLKGRERTAAREGREGAVQDRNVVATWLLYEECHLLTAALTTPKFVFYHCFAVLRVVCVRLSARRRAFENKAQGTWANRHAVVAHC